jgi:arylsulfatase A-like enzyme
VVGPHSNREAQVNHRFRGFETVFALMNIIIICSDTFRYDHLGFLNSSGVLTPNLDQLARESARFTNYRLCSFPTILNRMDVFTGRYTFPINGWGRLPYQFPILPQVFKHHGYTTGLIADNPHMMKDGSGFRRGFDFVKDVPGQNDDFFQPASTPMVELPCAEEKLEPRLGRLERYRRNAFWYRQRGTCTTEVLHDEVVNWLDNVRSKFFLWVDVFNPHEPWDAPQKYLEKYQWNADGDHIFWPRDGEADRYSPADQENMRSLYRAEVSQVDECIGRLMEHLRRKGVLKNTAVIFCSDHGYYFGEHAFVGKLFKRSTGPNKIYSELGHIPLLIRHPAGLGAGQDIPGFCQPPDLFATALDLVGLQVAPWAQGLSLVPRMHGEKGRQEFAIGGMHPHPRNHACITVWDEEWSMVYSPVKGIAGSELYHRPSDPNETVNVLQANCVVAEKQFDRIKKWFESLNVTKALERQLLHYENVCWTGAVRRRARSIRNQASYFCKYWNYARS